MQSQINSSDVNFVIITPVPNIALVKSTKTNIMGRYPKSSVMVLLPSEEIDHERMKEYNSFCPVYFGGETITGLMNTAMRVTKKPWNIFIMAGAYVTQDLLRKYSVFTKSTNDVVFPVFIGFNKQGQPVDIYSEFCMSTLNGIMINKELFVKTGDFQENSMQISKLLWQTEALTHGANFIPILGVTIT